MRLMELAGKVSRIVKPGLLTAPYSLWVRRDIRADIVQLEKTVLLTTVHAVPRCVSAGLAHGRILTCGKVGSKVFARPSIKTNRN